MFEDASLMFEGLPKYDDVIFKINHLTPFYQKLDMQEHFSQRIRNPRTENL